MSAKWVLVGVLSAALGLTAWAAEDPPAEKPPAGWSVYVSPTKAFSVFLPDGGRRKERTANANVKGLIFKVSLVEVDTKDMATLRASQIGVTLKKGERIDSNAAIEAFRDGFLKEVGGTVTNQSDVMLGKMKGKEYLIDTAKGGQAKLRIYSTSPSGSRVYQVSITGTKEQIDNDTAKMFFNSYKHQGMVADDLKKQTEPTTPK